MEEEGDLNQLIISIPKTTITNTKWTETEKHTQIYIKIKPILRYTLNNHTNKMLRFSS